MRELLPSRSLVLTWIALLGLLAATLSLAYVPMGIYNTVTGLGISAIKAALVVVLFMKLLDASPIVRIAAAAGLFWLAFLFALSATDYMTRNDSHVSAPAPERER
jgi:cytochrome c oxidase subunit 4